MREYNHKDIESKWQKIWEKRKVFAADDKSKKPKFYGLIEFPYPSGDGLHVGHIRSNTAMDAIVRKRRMEGFNVLYPIGWDAFGLPTENYAIKTGIHPTVVTKQNTGTFRRQLKALGYSFDWSREINTTDPKYYKWTQWIFLQLLKHGLAYKKKMPINWCPKDKIGLANEEVVDGCCERCGTPVEKRDKEQWMLGITKYADRLDKDLDTVDFLEKIKIQQRNWIGKSEGVNFKEKVKDLNIQFEVYDSVPQTFLAQTFTVIAPEHPLVEKLVEGTKYKQSVIEFVDQIKKRKNQKNFDIDKEMEGIFTGRYVDNPFGTGDLPIWVASYVVADYGTGIVNCSAHDERDFAFAKKYKIPLREVAEPLFVKMDGVDAVRKDLPFVERQAITAIVKHWSEDKYIGLKWKKVDWDTFITGGVEKGQTPEEAARAEITEETGYKNLKLIRELPRFHSKFFHVPKNENRFAHFSSFLFQLTDGEKNESSSEEKLKHDVVWLTSKELETFRLPEGHRLAWEAVNGIEKPIVKNGILLEPAELRGREWSEVREDVIKYIEKKGYGVRATQYKLRDWVFSRQHYWGEPIPVVFCEHCANRKYNIIIIHGYGSSSKETWKPWLKAELEKRGHKVYCPDLPNTDTPNVKEQAEFILKNAKLDKNTIIIGHSLGGPVMMRVLEKAKTKIYKTVFLDAVLRPKFNDKERSGVAIADDWKFNFSKIKIMSREFVVLADEDYSTIPKEDTAELAKIFDAKVILTKPNEPHFRGENEPEILKIFDEEGTVPIPEKYLPVELPKVEKYQPTDTGESPLAGITKWVNTKCPRCGGLARRETDTMPNWAGSSWYYLRYADPKNNKEFASRDKLNYWTPVNWYNGGMEHTTLHLLYSRFWHKFLFDLGLVPTSEPYKKRTSHGLILAEGGVKMSKSKPETIINPDGLVERFGADSLRLYEMFMGPFDQTVAWSPDGIVGTRRFIEKVWRVGERITNKELRIKEDKKLGAVVHRTIKKVEEDIEEMRFNTAISALMICANEMDSAESVPKELFEMFIKILSPFAPHVSEELWQNLGHKDLIIEKSWPAYDPNKIKDEEVTIVVQVNGKVRGQFEATPDISEAEAVAMAKLLPDVQKWLADKPLKKAIFVKGRLVNFVV